MGTRGEPSRIPRAFVAISALAQRAGRTAQPVGRHGPTCRKKESNLMRKYRYLAVVAAGGILLAAPLGTAFAATAHSAANKPVLLLGNSKGKAVKNGAKIGASLAKGQKVQFSVGSFKAACTESSFTAKVVKNPASKGKATLSLTGETVKKCALTTTISGVSLVSVVAEDLPANATITSKGAFTISEASKSKPLAFAATVDVTNTDYTCVFSAASAKGKSSNKKFSVSLSGTFTLNQALSPASGYALCQGFGIKSSTFAATYGPVTDTSVKHHPKVFVG
jgi:hypothetical protein